MSSTSLISRLRGSSVQIQALAFVAAELWRNGRDRVQRNLRDRERSEFLELTRKSRGRPGNLSERERRRFSHLVRKAATGDGDSDWIEVAKTLPTLVPPAALADAWTRFRRRL
ncbi:MAG: hypothetical protein M3M99_00190 [Actinomycetota bacterium]|nr:hypothetical protein [Actinomycetota bacterium]